MNKKGLSAVVANVLIVLLVIVGVAIIAAFIYPVLKDTGSEIDITKFTLNLKIIEDSVLISSGSGFGKLEAITIQRKSGSGNFIGIKLILIGEDGRSMFVQDIGVYELSELESVELNFANGGVDYYSTIGELTEIRVAPVWKLDEGEERIGNPTDEYFTTGYESSIFGDPLVEDDNPLSTGPFLRTWPFDEDSELEIPSGAVCTLGCGGSTTDHECYDPYYLDDRPHWYLIGNSDSGGSNPFIDTAPDGTTIAAQLNNRLGMDTHSRVVVPMSRPNPDIYYIGFDFYIETDSFDYPIANSHQIFSMRRKSSNSCLGPSNQQNPEVTIFYKHVKEYIQLDNWARVVVKHDVQSGVVELIYEGTVIKSYPDDDPDDSSPGFSPGQESHQFQLRSRDNGSHGAIWFNNLAVGTDYDDVLNYQG